MAMLVLWMLHQAHIVFFCEDIVAVLFFRSPTQRCPYEPTGVCHSQMIDMVPVEQIWSKRHGGQ